MSDAVARVGRAVEQSHGLHATHINSVPVRALLPGGVPWRGTIEVFILKGYTMARRCYAWSFESASGTRYVSVLASPVIDSPEKALQLAIDSGQMN